MRSATDIIVEATTLKWRANGATAMVATFQGSQILVQPIQRGFSSWNWNGKRGTAKGLADVEKQVKAAAKK